MWRLRRDALRPPHKAFEGPGVAAPQWGDKRRAVLSMKDAALVLRYEKAGQLRGVLFTDSTASLFNWLGTSRASADAFREWSARNMNLNDAATYEALPEDTIMHNNALFRLVNSVKWAVDRPPKYLHIEDTRHLFHDTIKNKTSIKYMRHESGCAVFKAFDPRVGAIAHKAFVDFHAHRNVRRVTIKNVKGFEGEFNVSLPETCNRNSDELVLDFTGSEWQNYQRSQHVVRFDRQAGCYRLKPK